MPRLLELFCGTKSVGKVAEQRGYDVVSLDFNPKFNATITEDIMEWDYTQFPPDYFDVIWGSPDCRTWSFATAGKYRTKDEIWGHEDENQEEATLGGAASNSNSTRTRSPLASVDITEILVRSVAIC